MDEILGPAGSTYGFNKLVVPPCGRPDFVPNLPRWRAISKMIRMATRGDDSHGGGRRCPPGGTVRHGLT